MLEALLDAASIGLVILAFRTTLLSAEFIFHCVFVLLVLHAFMFGLRGTLVRIGLVSIPLVLYADAKALGLAEPPLELTEWPLMFVIAILVAWMAELRNATSRRYARLFGEASGRLLTVEEDERSRIAGDLHDGVGQVLTALTLTLDAAKAATEPRVVRRRIVAARRLAATALEETRHLSHRMRPGRLEQRGLVAAVRDLAAQSGFSVVVAAGADASDPALLDPTTTVQVYRIIQEALANAARHSGARGARVTIAPTPDELTIVVADDGRGFSTARVRATGLGLAGMEERARLVGGRLRIASAPKSGTVVTLSVPLHQRRSRDS